MNHPSQFASLPPRASAKAADARPSLLPASAATSIVHDQRDDHRRAGQPVWGRDDHLPVRVNLFRGQDLPERLGRGALLRSFSGRPSGCVNTRLAKPINHTLRGCTHHRFAKGSERHFIVSSLDSRDANEIGLTDAQILFAPGAKTHD